MQSEDGMKPALLSVREVAAVLGVSESWVRRHLRELPVVRTGRLIRFNQALLLQQFHAKQTSGNRLRTGGKVGLQLQRYQRGCVYQAGKKVKVWYGVYREDVRKPDGTTERRQRNVRLGTFAELPTKNAARKKLAELLENTNPSVDMEFRELAERWEQAEGPTMKSTTLGHYKNALRAYVVPAFGTRKISNINREDIQLFLAEQAKRYSGSALRSMRVVLGLTLGWAKNCGWLEKNPCERIKLPQATGGRKVARTVLTAEQVNALAGKLEEPYATLVLFLAATGLRIGEAIAIRWSDFEGNVVHITRRLYDGDVDAVKTRSSVRSLPLDEGLITRMRQLGGNEWVFRSRNGTPVNPGNALRRYIRPATESLGIALGGWHDFRHTLSTKMRRNGVHPKVVSSILGHAKVQLAMDCYDLVGVQDFEQPLADVAGELLRNVMKGAASA